MALGEARRVLSPEGRILLMDLDWETWIVDADSQGVTRAIVRAFAETIPQKWMGRRLYSLLRDAGFADITVEVHTLPFTDFEQTRPILVSFAQAAVAASAISKSEGDLWLDEKKGRAASGRFFFAIPIFVAFARR